MSNRAGFRYGRDPVCLVAGLLYVVNRCWWKPLTPAPDSFLHCHLGDVLCLPVCVPIVLWLQRRCGLRRDDLPPTVGELAGHWLLWSWCFEWLGPRLPLLAPGAVADPWDTAAYAAGGLVAGWIWRSPVTMPVTCSGPGLAGRCLLSFGFALLVLSTYALGASWR